MHKKRPRDNDNEDSPPPPRKRASRWEHPCLYDWVRAQLNELSTNTLTQAIINKALANGALTSKFDKYTAARNRWQKTCNKIEALVHSPGGGRSHVVRNQIRQLEAERTKHIGVMQECAESLRVQAEADLGACRRKLDGRLRKFLHDMPASDKLELEALGAVACMCLAELQGVMHQHWQGHIDAHLHSYREGLKAKCSACGLSIA